MPKMQEEVKNFWQRTHKGINPDEVVALAPLSRGVCRRCSRHIIA